MKSLCVNYSAYWCLFQILLHHRSTSSGADIVNTAMNDGTTPLMTAVKLAVEEMVEDLLKAKADVNAADCHGTFECCLCNQLKLKTISKCLLRCEGQLKCK